MGHGLFWIMGGVKKKGQTFVQSWGRKKEVEEGGEEE